MFESWMIVSTALLYLVALFAIAWLGDLNARIALINWSFGADRNRYVIYFLHFTAVNFPLTLVSFVTAFAPTLRYLLFSPEKYFCL